ncbi:TetR/AcrR family transcriptional regulator [Uniformispora flossi]|uniref:TetR/AcrR family transcriptional regulator n=1 Tax=Uniformispora flossi TaxID=3390723 RepID=UPI003C2AD307
MRAEPPPAADQPEVPTPGWRTPRKAARPPRRARLTVDAIVDVALEIVDTEGLDALSMRRVAQKLDTGAASLYAHVANKEDLIELVLDRVSGEMSFPEPDPEHWGDQMQEGMRQIRDIYARHRDLAKANFGRIPTTPHSLEAMEGMLAVLKAGGLPDKVIAWSADLIALYATSAAYEMGLRELREEQNPGWTERYYGQIGAFFAALPKERFPVSVSMLDALTQGDDNDRFDFGLDVIMLGMQAYAERMRANGEA